jgi:AraC-like DNA-binding protein
MSTQGLINRYARAFIHCAAARGYDYATVCRAVGIRPDNSVGEQRDFDPPTLARLSREVKLLLQDEFCGLTTTRFKIGAYELMLELAVFTDTLEEALRKAFHFYAVLADDVQFELKRRDDTAQIRVQLARPQLDPENFLSEWWFLNWRAIASWLIGEQIPFLSVAFTHHPAAPFEDYAQVFCKACKFAQAENWFGFDSKYLAKRIIRNMDDVKEFVANPSIDLVSIRGVEHSLRARIKAQLQNHFYETQLFFSMEEVAEQYHMSSQTLRRHLEEEGSSYRIIKEEIRREVVMKWLGNPQISISEVSRMGGFAEPNGLTRAVKSWIGLSPKAYRDSVTRREQS